MGLSHWLKKAGISQRELARRVGYSSNGMVSKILKEQAYVPQDQVPQWADALELQGADRARFIDECSQKAIPDWTREQILKLQRQVRGLSIIVAPPPDDIAVAIDEWAEKQDKSTVIHLLIRALSANIRLAGYVEGHTTDAKAVTSVLVQNWSASQIAVALDDLRALDGHGQPQQMSLPRQRGSDQAAPGSPEGQP